MIGAHFGNAIQDWPNAIKLWPSGIWHKVCNDQHMCRDIKANNPGAKVDFRYIYDGRQQPSADFDTNVQKARDFFNSFIDGTFWQQGLHQWMDSIEEWNEYFSNSMDATEKAIWIKWCKAVNIVWNDEYRFKHPELEHIRLVSCNTAIGNDIPMEAAAITAQYDNLLGYHNYCNVLDKNIHPDDWKYYSGRWTEMDKLYRANGIQVKWLFTEGGATAMGNSVTTGQYHSGVYEGWKHPASYNGDFQAYMDGAMTYQLDNITTWNKSFNNRCLGGVFFTSTTDITGQWKYFNLDTPHLMQIAALLEGYEAPVEPPPVEPPPAKPKNKTWMSLVWSKTVEYQESHGVQLNAAAGLQKQIVQDFNIPAGMGVIVHNEMPFRDADGYYVIQTVESYDGQLRTVYVYQTGQPIWTFTRQDFQV